mgnify:CR=1 FL=1
MHQGIKKQKTNNMFNLVGQHNVTPYATDNLVNWWDLNRDVRVKKDISFITSE